MIKFGEAVFGNEVKAVVNLIIGKGKEMDEAFTNALTRTPCPLFANLRPNLIVKPLTLVVPRHPIDNEIQDELLNGVIQYGIAKAIADLDLEEDLKIIATVSVPDIPLTTLSKRKLFQYYYGATKLAINRALNEYPSKEKIKKEKYRALHPLVGFRDVRLERPPYLQVALDVPTIENLEFILNALPKSDRIILEAGTPLIKKFGIEVIEHIREYFDGFIVADLKTLDTGRVEVRMAFESTANAVAISGVAPKSTILKGIHECQKCGIMSYLDMMNVENPINLYNSLKLKPDVVILHRGIDEETFGVKKEFGIGREDIDTILAIAGGVNPENVDELIKNYDILIVGRAITKSRDPGRVARMFVNRLGDDIEQYRLYLDEDEEIDI
jgi:bifunctional enzyme Fae/Hps